MGWAKNILREVQECEEKAATVGEAETDRLSKILERFALPRQRKSGV